MASCIRQSLNTEWACHKYLAPPSLLLWRTLCIAFVDWWSIPVLYFDHSMLICHVCSTVAYWFVWYLSAECISVRRWSPLFGSCLCLKWSLRVNALHPSANLSQDVSSFIKNLYSYFVCCPCSAACVVCICLSSDNSWYALRALRGGISVIQSCRIWIVGWF